MKTKNNYFTNLFLLMTALIAIYAGIKAFQPVNLNPENLTSGQIALCHRPDFNDYILESAGYCIEKGYRVKSTN